jgi:hypothetical protein
MPLVLRPAAEALGLPPPPVPVNRVTAALHAYLAAFVLFLLLRRPWLYWPAFVLQWVVLVYAAEPQATTGDQAVMTTAVALHWGVIVWCVYRFGWLGNMVGASCVFWLAQTPLTADSSAWYFGRGLLGAAVVLALGAWAVVTAVGGQRLFREGFFGDE